MIWSNWQGAIWRGAIVVLLFWSGLAWTQTSAPRPSGEGTDRIMVVHENGRATRCRVVESWKLPDGRIAHLLQALESNEMITIVDERSPSAEPAARGSRAMPKRIFAWGLGKRTPPEGSPVPPQLRHDSGIVLQNEASPPIGALPTEGPVIVNTIIDEKAVGGTTRNEGNILNFNQPATNPIVITNGQTAEPPGKEIANAQLIEFPNGTPGEQKVIPVEAPGQAPLIVNAAPKFVEGPVGQPCPTPPTSGQREPLMPRLNAFLNKPLLPSRVVHEKPQGVPSLPATPVEITPPTPIVSNPPLPVENVPAQPGPIAIAPAPVGSIPMPQPTPEKIVPGEVAKPIATIPATPTPVVVESTRPAPTKPAETTAKKSWRPGDVLLGWMKKETPTAPPAPSKSADPWKATEEAKKPSTPEEILGKDTKVAEKKIAERVEKLPRVPFSTAVAQSTPPEVKKPEPAPLAIPSAPKSDDKVVPAKPEPIAPIAPIAKPEPIAPVAKPEPKSPEAPTAVKPAGGVPEPEKRSMWGTADSDRVPAPGKALLDPKTMKPEPAPLPAPPVARTNDPLASPERYIPKDDRLKPKAAMLPAVSNPGTDPEPRTPLDRTPAARTPAIPEAAPNAWPLGAQSVLAARSGQHGPVAYVPVPLMTTPQPNTPPGPPPPQIPEAPQLNAYVNAFSPPAAPKPAVQQGASSVPTWMQPNPMVMQQQMMQQQMMQQAMMQQQMMQQQMMLAQGYRPSPYGQPQMPYGQPMPSQGPMSNMARHYAGPMPPSPYAPSPMMAGGYYPASNPPMMPMNAMMPQAPAVQQVNYAPAPAAQTSTTGQVEQLIKVMRESPYPAQREWAAQSLLSFEWRAHPQVVPALLSSASQDPAPSVRAGCVSCLGRMGAAVEPVFATLHGMRNDIDPRVRQEVEQAFARLGQTPMAPQQ